MHAADKDAADFACEALMAQRLNVATQRCCCHSQTPGTQKRKKRGYMVCTSDYVATNPRKTKEGYKKFSGRQAVTQRRPTPRKPLCVRHDTWLCRQNRQSHHTHCKFYVGITSDRLVQNSVGDNKPYFHHHHQITKLSHSINAIGPAPHRSGRNHTLCSIAGGLNSPGRSWPAMT
jgi:hypothetical protein